MMGFPSNYTTKSAGQRSWHWHHCPQHSTEVLWPGVKTQRRQRGGWGRGCNPELEKMSLETEKRRSTANSNRIVPNNRAPASLQLSSRHRSLSHIQEEADMLSSLSLQILTSLPLIFQTVSSVPVTKITKVT